MLVRKEPTTKQLIGLLGVYVLILIAASISALCNFVVLTLMWFRKVWVQFKITIFPNSDLAAWININKRVKELNGNR